MNIYLIRHGQTTGDIEDRYGGDYDDHLTEEGHKQSEQLAEKLINSNIEIIFCSPKIRAQETAKYLSEKLICEAEIINDLRERNHYGILTGVIKSQAGETHPHLVTLINDRTSTIEGAETYESLKERVIKVFKEIIRSDHETIAILTHGGVIRAIFREILDEGEINIDDCAYALIQKNEDKLQLISKQGIIFQSD